MSGQVRRAVRVRAPASSANLGPGFDCAGLCLALYHELTVREYGGRGFELHNSGEGADSLPEDETSLVYRALGTAFGRTDHRPGRLVVESHSDIPLARGLGSSAAAGLAGLAAGFALAGLEVERPALLDLAMGSEGHADNAAPCLYGGFTVACRHPAGVRCARLPVPEGLTAVVAIPDFTLATSRSRAVLPRTVDLADAVGNQGRLAQLVAAMATGQLDLLADAMVDCLHQPYRAPLVPGFEAVCRAALAAGALGAALSGSGPTIIALATGGQTDIAAAMAAAWAGAGIRARTHVLEVDEAGLQVELIEGDSAT